MVDVHKPGDSSPEHQAAFQFLDEGRPDLAIAPLEYGTAFLLWEQVERRRCGISRLTDMGHQALLDEYVAMARGMAGIGTVFVLDDPGGQIPADISRLNQLTEEIRRVLGRPDFLRPMMTPDLIALGYPDPVVYVIPGPVMGYAIILFPLPSPRIVYMRLGRFTTQAVEEHVLPAAFTYRREEQENKRADSLDALARWCWDVCMGPICDQLPPGTRATIVPIGYAGLLPLHVAWTPNANLQTGRMYAIDRVCLSYAPNLRIAAHRRSQAAQPAAAGAAAAAFAPNAATDLPLSLPEAFWVRRLRGGRVLADEEASPPSFLESIGRSWILHFAGHAHSSFSVPLASSLWFRDTQLTMLQILDSPIQKESRLGVLSCCVSSLGSIAQPAQAVTLVNALLACGLLGAVASLWRVRDDDTALLMARFYQMLSPGLDNVPEALRGAQVWFRDAPDAQLKSLATEVGCSIDLSARDRRRPLYWGGFQHVGA